MSEEKKGFFARLKSGLTKTRENIVRGIDSVFNGFSAIDDDFYEELEEILHYGRYRCECNGSDCGTPEGGSKETPDKGAVPV